MALAALLAGCVAASNSQPKPPPELAVRYVCNDNTRFMAHFIFAEPQQVRLERAHMPAIALPRQEAERGFLYGDGHDAFAGFGDRAEWRAEGAAPTTCLTKGPPPPYFPGAALARPSG